MIDLWEKYNLLQIVSLHEKNQSANLANTYLHDTILEERGANKSICECLNILQKLFTALIIKF